MHPALSPARLSPSGRRVRPRRAPLWRLFWLAPSLLWLFACAEAEPTAADAKSESSVSVELVRVEPEFLSDVVALTGQLDAENAVVVKPEVDGVVASIDFQEGQAIEEGDVLVGLRDAEQRARLKEAQAELRLANDVNERTQRLARQDAASIARRTEAGAELDKARARVDLARLELDRTRIRAPFKGVAGLRRVAPGDRVESEDGLVEILAIDRLQLVFTVQEIGVPLARVGIPVSARVIAWPGERFPGEVFFVSPSLDPASRRLVLKAWIDNAEHKLKPGMFANVDVEIARKEEALLVPEAAVVYDRNGVYLWRLGEERRAEKVPVEVGLRQEGRVEILSGIAAGDAVVAAGVHKVKAGSLLEGVPAPASEHAGEPAAEAVGGEKS